MRNPSNYYVYGHRTPCHFPYFYIGKGKDRRAWSMNKRGERWENQAKHGAVEVVIIKDGMSEACAYTLERVIVDFWGTEWLANKMPGGTGPHVKDYVRRSMNAAAKGRRPHNYGKPMPEHQRESLRAINTGRKQSAETRAKRSTKVKGKKHPQLDRVWRYFINDNGESFYGLRYDFIRLYNLSPSKVCNIISGKRSHHKGWRVA